MKSRLFRNLGFKIFSLIIALFIWLYFFTVREEISPFRESAISFTVPVDVLQSQFSLLKVKIEPPDIRLTLKGKNLKKLEAKNILAFVKVNEIKEGAHFLPVYVDAPDGTEVVSKNPESVKVILNATRKRRRR